jgi:hypothetical protein
MPYTFQIVQTAVMDVKDTHKVVIKTWEHQEDYFGDLVLRKLLGHGCTLPSHSPEGIQYFYALERRLEKDGARVEYEGSLEPTSYDNRPRYNQAEADDWSAILDEMEEQDQNRREYLAERKLTADDYCPPEDENPMEAYDDEPEFIDDEDE